VLRYKQQRVLLPHTSSQTGVQRKNEANVQIISVSQRQSCQWGRGEGGGGQTTHKSSVLVSPVTLKTVTVIFSGTLALEVVNHSASAHDCMTSLA
jgi:hypothetical protein